MRNVLLVLLLLTALPASSQVLVEKGPEGRRRCDGVYVGSTVMQILHRRTSMSKLHYVVAVNKQEAEELAAEGYGHESKLAASRHLAKVKLPPTDAHYAAKYQVFTVKAPGMPKEGEDHDGRCSSTDTD
jgi:hypothetical protein